MSEFNSEGLDDSDFIALMSSDVEEVELSSSFPLELSWESEDRTISTEIPSEESSQDPDFEPVDPIPSDTLTELSLGSATAEVEEGERKARAEAGLVVRKTFASATELRSWLQAASVRGSNTSARTSPGAQLARAILGSLKAKADGWCRLSVLQPTKKDGYVQISYAGQNKFAILQDVLVWANGWSKGEGQQASHLCGHPLCTIPEHVCLEVAIYNNARKGCVVWVWCSKFCGRCSGLKVILCCTHTPSCIKFCEGFASQLDFLDNGICQDRRADLHQHKRPRLE